MDYQVITFDFDGTLCNTAPAITDALLQLFTDATAADINEQLQAGTPLKSVIATLHAGDLTAQHLEQLCLEYRSIYNNESYKLQRIYPFALHTLSEFNKLGCKCLIVSNKGEQALHQFVDNNALTTLIDYIIGERQGLQGKPHSDPYQQIIKTLYSELTPAKLLHIGDTAADIEFAHNIGADSVYLKHGFGDDDKCISLNPTYVFNDFKQLNEQLFKLGGRNA